MKNNLINSNLGTKRAFTLAEVLITLVIIGVIAAFTIPIFIQGQQERATVTALKKTYTTLSTAFSLAVEANGPPRTWDLKVYPDDFGKIINIIKPYLSITKDCSDGTKGCFPAGVTYKFLGSAMGGEAIYDNNTTAPRLILADGTLLLGWVDSADCKFSFGDSIGLQNICGVYQVDINGFKGPNQHGKDLFRFWITQYGLIPTGTQQQTSNSYFDGNCKDIVNHYGTGCTAWVMYNENLDYLKCGSQLSWGGQTKCN